MLPPLATLADLTRLGLDYTDQEAPLLEAYLEAASTAVREAAEVPISETTSTVTVEGGPSPWLRLPGPPVTAVDSADIDTEPAAGWRLSSGVLWRAGGWADGCGPAEVTVTYTHGLAEVPADIVMLVCRIAATTLLAWRSEEGGAGLAAGDIRSERIGDYSVTYGDDGSITELELSERLTERLRGRFGGGVALVRSR